MKTYSVDPKPPNGLPHPNRYQADFLYLKTLAEQVVPLEDRYFPPARRSLLEQAILQKLGEPGGDHKTFGFCIQQYLSEFNCQHAYIVDDPHEDTFSGYYPFRIHYFSNEVYLSNIARSFEASLIGQKVTAINGHPIAEIESNLFGFVSAESLSTKRASLEQDPFPYSRPDYYCFVGLSGSISNSLTLEFAKHEPVTITPTWKPELEWHRKPRPPHPITARAPHSYDCQIFPEHHVAYLQFNTCFDKAAIIDGLTMVRPWIRPLIRIWLQWQFQKDQPASVLSGIYDPERPYLKEYLAEALDQLKAQGVTNLILDLRQNPGGETELATQFIYFFTDRDDLLVPREFIYNPRVFAYYDPVGYKEFRDSYFKAHHREPPEKELLAMPERPLFHNVTDPESPYYVATNRTVFKGRLIVLVDHNTGSAASLMAGVMQDNQLGVVVGTTPGNNPTGPTGMTPFSLPRSGLMISLPTEYDERAETSRGDVLQPDHWVEESMDDLLAGRDAVFEKALELLQIHDAKAGPLLEEEIESAVDYLKALKKSGRQPGWTAKDKGEALLESYSYFAPKSITFAIRKHGDSSRYHYTLVRGGSAENWVLQKAWQTDRKGRIRQIYEPATRQSNELGN